MKKFTREQKSWIAYDWANSAYSLTITTAILPMYFKSVVQAGGMSNSTSTALWGYTVSLSTLIVSLLSPILGTIADYKGNKKKFFKFFFFIGVISTMLLAAVPSDKPLFLLICYGMTLVGFAGANIFYDAFLVDVASEDKMDRVSALGFGMGYIGSTIPFVISLALIMMSQQSIINLSVNVACKLSFLITAAWWFSFTIPMLKNVNQKYYIEPERKPVINSFKRLFKTISKVKENKNIFLFLIAYFFYIDGVGTIINMASSYGTDLGIPMVSLLVILLLTQIVAFPSTIIFGKLAERFGAKTLIRVGIMIYMSICIYAFFVKDTVGFCILAMAVATAQGGIQAISRSYYSKIIPKQNSNEYFGLYDVFGKFASIMGPFLVAITTQLTGKSNYGIFSIILLFIIGFVLLNKVQIGHTVTEKIKS